MAEVLLCMCADGDMHTVNLGLVSIKYKNPYWTKLSKGIFTKLNALVCVLPSCLSFFAYPFLYYSSLFGFVGVKFH